jgi:hypothetical protein
MCRAKLDKIDVYKIYVRIAEITVPFYFCRENYNVESKSFCSGAATEVIAATYLTDLSELYNTMVDNRRRK